MDIINVTVLIINCRYFIVKSMFVIKCDNWSKHFVACLLELYVFKWFGVIHTCCLLMTIHFTVPHFFHIFNLVPCLHQPVLRTW